jgi:hypothetical protein
MQIATAFVIGLTLSMGGAAAPAALFSAQSDAALC